MRAASQKMALEPLTIDSFCHDQVSHHRPKRAIEQSASTTTTRDFALHFTSAEPTFPFNSFVFFFSHNIHLYLSRRRDAYKIWFRLDRLSGAGPWIGISMGRGHLSLKHNHLTGTWFGAGSIAGFTGVGQ
jgi:hypothetical protein